MLASLVPVKVVPPVNWAATSLAPAPVTGAELLMVWVSAPMATVPVVVALVSLANVPPVAVAAAVVRAEVC